MTGGTSTTTARPILPYPEGPLVVLDHDPAWEEAADRLIALIHERRPGLDARHVGSSAVPDLPAKPILDLNLVAPADEVPGITDDLLALGFQRQWTAGPFPPTRPMVLGGFPMGETTYRVHAHVIPTEGFWAPEARRNLAFRDALRVRPDLRDRYASVKREILAEGITDPLRYSTRKTAVIRGILADIGEADPPLAPGSTIGILGGGQLGRMLAMAARALGYRVVALDPDPDCPARHVVDRLVVAPYTDVAAGLELAEASDVVTVELEHVGYPVVEAIDAVRLCRPAVYVVAATQDRLAERRFLDRVDAPVSPWREVRTLDELRTGADELGYPLRLKAALGGYDGRSQVRVAAASDLEGAFAALERAATANGLLLEREVDFVAECSVVLARDAAGRSKAFPVALNRHDDGILVESVAPAPAPVTPEVAQRAQALAARLAMELDLEGTLTVELFLLVDGSLVVNELAPRVHNSGHWTLDGAATGQFEQHIRAIAGLPLGDVSARGASAMVNLLGTGRRRPARLTGTEAALADPGAHLHVYDKREVFERRKMGHLTVVAGHGEQADALERALRALGALRFEEEERQ
ncbi:MAG TPA: 5-(carboxyamino)imidazole ribonucleotide synthase [Candidatus Binatia bacterium]|nr:5-(carboxyamino)imidazole ribonucleotide synthase [Candidatus Binatia bacterium]